MRRFLLAAALAICAANAFADMTLVAPRAGDRLEGGSEAMLSWSATSLPSGVEEWEAFLSVDGGRYYAVRITPHLDAGIRTFRFRVPNVATTRARLLLRVGDEENEHLIELPQTFTIVPRYAALDLSERHVRDDAGSDGAIEWVAPDLVRYRRNPSSTSNAPRITASASLDEPAEEVPTAEYRLPSTTNERIAPNSVLSPQSSVLAPNILLLSTRLNC